MLRAWTVAENRAAEVVRLAQVPDGALMQRAAAGLAAVCARELRARTGGVSGRRVVLLVGAGNNGGDALWAGARLAARGARVDAVLLAGVERTHAEGLAALQAAGGSVAEPGGSRPDVPAGTHLVIDGIVGLGERPACGSRPPTWWPASPPGPVWWRWICRAGSTRTPGSCRHRTVTARPDTCGPT